MAGFRFSVGTKGWMVLSELMASALVTVELMTMASYSVSVSKLRAPLASTASTV